jgi:hypothetical protein
MRMPGVVSEMSNNRSSQCYPEILKEQETEFNAEEIALAHLAGQASVTSKLAMLDILAVVDYMEHSQPLSAIGFGY